MKKVLSFLLIFTLAIGLFGSFGKVQAAEGDVTIYLHIHEFDGDYTGTNTGIWDGVTWNEYGDAVSSTDTFGGVIEKVYSAAEIAAVSDEIEFKPNTDKTTAADGDSLLAPGEGKVFADVTKLKDGTLTELHLYYVEGAKDFFVAGDNTLGLAFVVYANPVVASNPDVYKDWGIHTWDTGSDGTSVEWSEPLLFDIEVELDTGDYDVPMRLAVIEVDDDASNEIGFIVHEGDNKSCNSNMSIDVTTIKTGTRGVFLYEHTACEFTADWATFAPSVDANFKASLKNKFIEGTAIVDPAVINVKMFTQKAPYTLLPDRFTVKDSEGTVIPFDSIAVDGITLGEYTSDVVIQSQTRILIYVNDPGDHTKLGVVGTLQNLDGEAGDWTETSPVLSSGDDINGYAVWEFATYESTAAFKILHDEDANGFTWGDTQITPNNIELDLNGGTIELYFDASNPAGLQLDDPAATSATIGDFSYTGAQTCAAGESKLVVIVNSRLDSADVAMVGSVQDKTGDTDDWKPDLNPIMPVGTTLDGELVFEVCTTEFTGEYKILYDADSAFNWGDHELVTSNQAYDLGAADSVVAYYVDGRIDRLSGNNYSTTLASTYRLSVYLKTDLPIEKLGIVGTVNGWADTNPITTDKVDAYGNIVFDIPIESKTGTFKMLYDETGNGFAWGDPEVVNFDLNFDLGEEQVGIIYLDDSGEELVVEHVGADLEGIVLDYVTVNFASDEFVWGETYTIEYVDMLAQGEEDAYVISYTLPFVTSNDFTPGDPVVMEGTYAMSPMEILVQLRDVEMLIDSIELVEGTNVIPVESYDYTMGTVGTYTPTLDCGIQELLTIHLNYSGSLATLGDLGLVGSVQGWNPGAAITPTGFDSVGNVVFEVCVYDASNHEVKILEEGERESGFAWGDPEVTPGNVKISIDGATTVYVEEGNTATGSMYHTIKLAESNKLDVTKDYMLKFTDANGFVVYIELDIDNEAPVVDFAIVPDTDFEVSNASPFDIMEFFTKIQFLDNRDGELDFTYVTEVDLDTLGEQTITIKAVDAWMNETTHSFTVTVVDITAPLLTIDAAKEYDAGTEEPNWEDFASVDEGTITVDDSQVDMDNNGTFYVNYSANDGNGNVSSGSLMVTISGAEEPATGCFSSFSIGGSIIVLVAALGGAVLYFVRKK